MLNLPYSNDLEQIHGVFRTGLARFRPRNYGWRRLQEAQTLPSIPPALEHGRALELLRRYIRSGTTVG